MPVTPIYGFRLINQEQKDLFAPIYILVDGVLEPLTSVIKGVEYTTTDYPTMLRLSEDKASFEIYNASTQTVGAKIPDVVSVTEPEQNPAVKSDKPRETKGEVIS